MSRVKKITKLPGVGFLPVALSLLLILILAACADDGAAPQTPGAPDDAVSVSDQEDQQDEPGQEQSADRADAQGKLADPDETPASSDAGQDDKEDGSVTRPSATAVPEQEIELVVCLEGEIPQLFLYGDQAPASVGLRHALNENLYTSLGYAYQPQGLEKLPSLADGDAQRVIVSVDEGDRLLDADGSVVSLRKGVSLIDAAGELVAYSGEPIAMEQLVVDFRFQPMVWSDGSPFNASDSVFSFNVAADPAITGGKNKIAFTESYKATGDLSVRWTGIPGYLDPDYFTNVWQPLPAKTLRSFTAAELARLENGDENFLSSGPYVVSGRQDDNSLLLAPNEHYYRAADGIPNVGNLLVRFGSAEELLGDASCDVVAGGAVGMHNLQELEGSGTLDGWEIITSPGNIYEQIAFGVVPVNEYAKERPAWFADVRVRQAIAQCVDRQRMADELTGGNGELLHTLVPGDHPLAAVDLNNWQHDPAAANALLDAAGYQDYAGDGRRQDVTSGVPMTITLGTNSESTLRLRVTEMVQEDLAQCGIPVVRYDRSAGTWFYHGAQGPVFGRRFDLAELAWLGHIMPVCDRFTTDKIPGFEEAGFAGWDAPNITGWSNEAYDAACETAGQALPGSAAYDQSMREAIALYNEQLPALPLFTDYKAVAVRPGVTNIAPDPTQPSILWNIYEWQKRME